MGAASSVNKRVKRKEDTADSERGKVDGEEGKDEYDTVSDSIEAAWEKGFDYYESNSDFVQEELVSIASSALPGLFEVARDFPFVAPVAGAFLLFYQSYATSVANKEQFDKIRNRLNLSSQLLNDALPVIRDNLVRAVQNSTRVIRKLNRRYGESLKDASLGKQAIATAKSIALSGKDEEELKKCYEELNTAHQDLIGALPAIETLNAMKKTAKDFLHSLDPVLFTFKIRQLNDQFQKGSREWLFEEVEKWLDQSSLIASTTKKSGNVVSSMKRNVFWLRSGPGMGKSVFAAALANRLERKKPLSSSSSKQHSKIEEKSSINQLLGAFFFETAHPKKCSPMALIQSLAYQLGMKYPTIQKEILQKKENLQQESLDDVGIWFTELIIRPLEILFEKSPPKSNLLIIIDALDECGVEGDKIRKEFLKFLSGNLLKKLPSYVKILITSRPDNDILNLLTMFEPNEIFEDDRRHEDDLRLFIRSNLSLVMNDEKELEKATELMMYKSEKTFVYLSVIMTEVNEDDWTSEELTAEVLFARLSMLPRGLDEYYENYMMRLKKKKLDGSEDFLKVLVNTLQPISEEEMGVMLDKPMKLIHQYSLAVEAIFPLKPWGRATKNQPATTSQSNSDCQPSVTMKYIPFHKSIIDWLKDEKRSGNDYIDDKEGNKLILSRLLSLIGVSLPFHVEDGAVKGNYEIPSFFGANTLGVLTDYFYDNVLDHLDIIEWRNVSFHLLTSLSWLQGRLAFSGMRSLILDYLKRLPNESKWMEAIPIESSKDFLFVLELLRQLNWIPSSTYWPRELCTQITGRFQALTQSKDQLPAASIIFQLIKDAERWIEGNGGAIVLQCNMSQVGAELEGIIRVPKKCKGLFALTDKRFACLSDNKPDNTIYFYDIVTLEMISSFPIYKDSDRCFFITDCLVFRSKSEHITFLSITSLEIVFEVEISGLIEWFPSSNETVLCIAENDYYVISLQSKSIIQTIAYHNEYIRIVSCDDNITLPWEELSSLHDITFPPLDQPAGSWSEQVVNWQGNYFRVDLKVLERKMYIDPWTPNDYEYDDTISSVSHTIPAISKEPRVPTARVKLSRELLCSSIKIKIQSERFLYLYRTSNTNSLTSSNHKIKFLLSCYGAARLVEQSSDRWLFQHSNEFLQQHQQQGIERKDIEVGAESNCLFLLWDDESYLIKIEKIKEENKIKTVLIWNLLAENNINNSSSISIKDPLGYYYEIDLKQVAKKVFMITTDQNTPVDEHEGLPINVETLAIGPLITFSESKLMCLYPTNEQIVTGSCLYQVLNTCNLQMIHHFPHMPEVSSRYQKNISMIYSPMNAAIYYFRTRDDSYCFSLDTLQTSSVHFPDFIDPQTNQIGSFYPLSDGNFFNTVGTIYAREYGVYQVSNRNQLIQLRKYNNGKEVWEKELSNFISFTTYSNPLEKLPFQYEKDERLLLDSLHLVNIQNKYYYIEFTGDRNSSRYSQEKVYIRYYPVHKNNN